MFEFDPLHVAIAGLGAVIIAAHWLPRFVTGREPAAAPLLIALGFVVFGFLPGMPRALDPVANPKLWEHVTEFAVVVSLLGSGIGIDELGSRKRWVPAMRLLLVAMPLAIAGVALAGWAFGGLTLAGALLLGAVLAPTDPVLASDVQVGKPLEGGEHPVRFALTAEAGLNDGAAFPFVNLAILVAAGGVALGEWGVDWVARDLAWRVGVGGAAGWALGWVLGKLLFAWPRGATLAGTEAGVVAIAGALMVYGLTELVEGYGFIAVFVAGIRLRQEEREHEFHRTLHAFTTAIEHWLLAVVLVALGGALPVLLPALTWELVSVVLLLVFLIRPASGHLALTRSTLKMRERTIVAVYGVRGLGSVYYIAYASAKVELGAEERALWAAVAFAVIVSTVVHGLTAGFAVEQVAGPAKEPAVAVDA